MPYATSVKQRAHEIDRECWESYSGKPVELKRAVDKRRTAALLQAQKEHDDMRHPNGAPMWAPDGTLLDDKGNRSVFDDVDD